MKVALPIDEDNSMLCEVLGRTPYFLFYDMETGEKEVIQNPAAQAQSGAGIKVAQFLIDTKANVLITKRCGKNSAEVLQEAEIAIYKSEGTSVDENLTAFKNNQLSLLKEFHAGYHGIR